MKIALDKSKLLAAFKADLRAAETLKRQIDTKMYERRAIHEVSRTVMKKKVKVKLYRRLLNDKVNGLMLV